MCQRHLYDELSQDEGLLSMSLPVDQVGTRSTAFHRVPKLLLEIWGRGETTVKRVPTKDPGGIWAARAPYVRERLARRKATPGQFAARL